MVVDALLLRGLQHLKPYLFFHCLAVHMLRRCLDTFSFAHAIATCPVNNLSMKVKDCCSTAERC
jgi:hypothetical protein